MTRSHTATTIAPTVRGSYHWYGDGWPALDSRSCSPSTPLAAEEVQRNRRAANEV